MICTRSIWRAFAVALLVMGANTAHAQQLFEDKHVPARPSSTELVPLPTFGIVPLNTIPLDPNVADELTEAVNHQLILAQQTDRFEIVTRANGSKINWAFIVRNAPRAPHDAFTVQFTRQLVTCLRSLEDSAGLTSLDLLLLGLPAGDPGRNEALLAGQKMLDNWKADRCATQRNNSIPDDDAHRTRTTAATHGMLTNEFNALLFNGQALLDLIAAVKPLYFDLGGFWTTEMTPRLHAVFDAAVRDSFLSASETTEIGEIEQRTFWDWAVLAVLTKPTIARSVLANTAAGCVKTVPELSNRFQLSRCVSDGKIQLRPLRVGGEDYTAVQRVLP